jgi:hypothetical protein
MQLTIKNKISYDYGDYSIIVNGHKVAVLLSNDREKNLELSDDTPSVIYLIFNMFPTSNRVTITPNCKTSIIARRNFPVNILGYLAFLIFFVILGDYILPDSIWTWPLILFFGLAGLFLRSWKKLEIEKVL